jgi:hypothetical protein
MSETLEERIKKLEDQLTLKNAYLAVQITFPKGNKIPEEIKNQIVTQIKEVCAKLAEGTETQVSPTTGLPFTEEEVKMLKNVVASIKAKTNMVVNQPAPIPVKKDMDSGVDGVQKATLITLESVPSQHRSKVSPMEVVFVTSIKDGKARISTKSGLSIPVSVEDLEFNQQ